MHVLLYHTFVVIKNILVVLKIDLITCRNIFVVEQNDQLQTNVYRNLHKKVHFMYLKISKGIIISLLQPVFFIYF